MTIIIAVLVFLLGCLISYIAISTYETPGDIMESRLKSLVKISERRTDVEKVLSESFSQRVILPLGKKFEAQFTQLTPTAVTSMIEKRLLKAGGVAGLSAGQFIAVTGILTGTLALGVILSSILFKLKDTINIMLYAAALGVFIPHMLVSRKISFRQASIQKDLPDVLDLITVSVEAGLSFDGAISKVEQKMKGTLVEEFSRCLKEMRMGITRKDALKAMGKRCDNKDLSLLVTGLVQADQLGVSIGSMLRNQAVSIRESRKMQVEKQAQRAPVLMLLPLVICIMPSLFIVLLGPAAISLMTQFSK